tara:strand:- start:149 stop:1279 length:1131 start_codon:yes stop_codon:yes gene_type:complete
MIKTLEQEYKTYKNKSLFGRYIRLEDIEPILTTLGPIFKVRVEGYSVLNRPIHSVRFGTGLVKVLIWSQMHGNESTSSKALFDVFNYLKTNEDLLKRFSFLVVPMLNPDGSEAYTRVNANQVDLNRDAQALSQPESKVLHDIFRDFKPDFCLNLHGQRTIFSAGPTNKPATMSFLAPAEDINRTVTEVRKKAMRLICSINKDLQHVIPDQIGRYDDGFNANCVGDAFTILGIPTILFESGHYKDDYDREEVRKYTFLALCSSFEAIKNEDFKHVNHEDYFKIPENEKLFCDIIIKNVLIKDELNDVEIQFIEKLVGKKVKFLAKTEKFSKSSKLYAHRYYDANNSRVLTNDRALLYEGYETDFVIWKNDEKLILSK